MRPTALEPMLCVFVLVHKTYNRVYAVGITVNNFSDAYLSNFDTTCQTWTTRRISCNRRTADGSLTYCNTGLSLLLFCLVQPPEVHFPLHGDRDKYLGEPQHVHRHCNVDLRPIRDHNQFILRSANKQPPSLQLVIPRGVPL
jgi:hypothetical protein